MRIPKEAGMTFLSNFSNRELNIWSHLLLDVVVAVYYFSAVWTLSGGGLDVNLANIADLARVVGKIITFSIVYAIIVSIIINKRGEEPKDERDYRFEAKATGIAYVTLAVCVVLIMSQIFLNELGMAFWNLDRGNPILLTPAVTAHLLLISLIVAGAAKTLSQLVLYRRDVLGVGNA